MFPLNSPVSVHAVGGRGVGGEEVLQFMFIISPSATPPPAGHNLCKVTWKTPDLGSLTPVAQYSLDLLGLMVHSQL